MGDTPRRSAFRLPWSEASEPKPDEPAKEAAATPEAGPTPDAPAPEQPNVEPAAADATPGAQPETQEPSEFLRELVDAMRGVAESSRDSSLAELRITLDQRIEEMRAAAAERAEDLRRRSDHDITGIGEWERAEIERVRTEAEQRRDARRVKLERELADHQASSDREVEATSQRLADYERGLAAFFAELGEISDPATFVAAAKRMPPPPDLKGSASTSANRTQAHAAGAATETPDGGSANGETSETSLSQRLAQLDKQLSPSSAATPAEAAPAPETTPAAAPAPAPTTAPAVATPEVAAQPATETGADALTPIVVKGLGSFGAITSFKQALERVDGVRGVTLSLGPTGEFVYRASHAAGFDIAAAIRQIEGPGAGIEQAEGQVLVTIERQR
jgi:hypothetical protein